VKPTNPKPNGKIEMYVCRVRLALESCNYDLARRVIDDCESTVVETQITFDTQLTELDLPSRVQNSLERAGIRTVRDVLNCSTEELLSTRNIGVEAIREVREILAGVVLVKLAKPSR
jgi:DNA-directed RNA polymerase alpha subunit